MPTGIDRYYQFRELEMRIYERSQEHTHDLEMAFVDREDILGLIEELMISLAENLVRK